MKFHLLLVTAFLLLSGALVSQNSKTNKIGLHYTFLGVSSEEDLEKMKAEFANRKDLIEITSKFNEDSKISNLTFWFKNTYNDKESESESMHRNSPHYSSLKKALIAKNCQILRFNQESKPIE